MNKIYYIQKQNSFLGNIYKHRISPYSFSKSRLIQWIEDYNNKLVEIPEECDVNVEDEIILNTNYTIESRCVL